MTDLLQDKIVLVTGSSSGIGRAVSLAAARHGANLVLHHLGDGTLGAATLLADEIHALGRAAVLVAGDISLPSTAASLVSAATAAFGRIDVLVSNAGMCPFHAFLSLPHDLWRRTLDVNLSGAFYVVQAVANQMAGQEPRGGERGSIIAISSISALVGGKFQAHYTPTKAGVKSLMESCALALGGLGIRCNSVLPGTIETDMNRDDLADPAKRGDMTARVPLARLGAPEDVAGPVVFLASDMARYVTGASLLVDGGAAVALQ